MFTMSFTTTDLAIACVCAAGFYLLVLLCSDSDRKRRKAIPRLMRQRERSSRSDRGQR